QYVLLGSGFDTFPYRQPDWAKRMTIFEVDRPEVIEEKQKRLSQSGIDVPDNVNFIGADLAEENWIKQLLSHPDFSPKAKTMCSLLGLVYYLTREAFSALVQSLSILPEGSGVVFDYPNQLSGKLPALAHGASAPMMAFYSERDLTALLSAQGFRICEHLSPLEAAEQFFRLHQLANPDSTLTAPPHVSYCLSVRK
ncbi:MAG: class I SAM-dependent methyltransferase, partial [Oscillospiraceae bacterium]|nr:class I SAM-dependent methyltransferase [Oscillospiraceae bacterium]